MASAKHARDGEEFPDILTCPICSEARMPYVACGTCSLNMCLGCHGKVKACPQCKGPALKPPIPNRALLESFPDIKRCDNTGCDELLTSAQREEHARSCERRPRLCGRPGCTVRLTPGQTAAQHEAACLFREVSCGHAGCEEVGTVPAMTAHRSTCGHRIRTCPVNHCVVAQRDLMEHIRTVHHARVFDAGARVAAFPITVAYAADAPDQTTHRAKNAAVSVDMPPLLIKLVEDGSRALVVSARVTGGDAMISFEAREIYAGDGPRRITVVKFRLVHDSVSEDVLSAAYELTLRMTDQATATATINPRKVFPVLCVPKSSQRTNVTMTAVELAVTWEMVPEFNDEVVID